MPHGARWRSGPGSEIGQRPVRAACLVVHESVTAVHHGLRVASAGRGMKGLPASNVRHLAP